MGKLVRKHAPSSVAIVLGLALMWVMVDRLGSNEVIAAGASFMAANSIHNLLATDLVFGGSDRGWGESYVCFLMNGAVGLVITVLLFALLMRWTMFDYLAARAIVSILAGRAIFMRNAMLNIKRF